MVRKREHQGSQMETTQYTTETNFVPLIEAEFVRLHVDADTDPYSGVMVEAEFVRLHVVKVYDDYTDGKYYAAQLLAILKEEDYASLDPDSDSNIWEVIRPAAI